MKRESILIINTSKRQNKAGVKVFSLNVFICKNFFIYCARNYIFVYSSYVYYLLFFRICDSLLFLLELRIFESSLHKIGCESFGLRICNFKKQAKKFSWKLSKLVSKVGVKASKYQSLNENFVLWICKGGF